MLKYAVIGTSDITKQYIRSAKSTELWSLEAVYSRNMNTGKAFASEFDVDRVYTDLLEFATSTAFEAVYVASPNAFHYEQCKILLENKKHVICEKPFTTYEWQLKELFQLAEKSGVVLMEAIMFMHQPSKKILGEAIESLGEVSMALFDNSRISSKYDAFLNGELPNIFNPNMHTGALMDMGVYTVFPALYYFGEPKEIKVSGCLLESGADGFGSVQFQYLDKVVEMRYSKIGSSTTGSDVQGKKGSIKIASILHMGGIVSVNHKDEETLLAEVSPKIALMGNEARDFYHYITGEGKCIETYEECKRMSFLVCRYLEMIRKEVGLSF